MADLLVEPLSPRLNFSRATELESVTLACGSNPQRVIQALRTITPDHWNLQWIGIDITAWLPGSDLPPPFCLCELGKVAHRGWLELDRLLVQLWESHSIYVKVYHQIPRMMDSSVVGKHTKGLLREIRMRRAVKVIYVEGHVLGGEVGYPLSEWAKG